VRITCRSALRPGDDSTAAPRREPCYDCSMMPRPLRALASVIVGITTIVGMMVYQHYSREPPTDAFAAAVTMAATILVWMVTGLE
jgi:hypothetical protein